MRLAAYTDYGLRVLMRLAGTPDEAISTRRIANEFAISQHDLAKVVRDLRRGGFVASQRGRTLERLCCRNDRLTGRGIAPLK